MTAKEFAARHPKPWHFVIGDTSFSLKDAKGDTVGVLSLRDRHVGIPQKEWHRHIASALSEKMPVIEAHAETARRRALIEMRQPGGPLLAKEHSPAERIDSASPSPESTAEAQSPRGSGKE